MRKYLIRLTAAIALALALAPVAQPQEFDPDEALTQPVRTIEDPELITFSTGKKDQYVNGLEKSDFLLFDNGVQQNILEFDVSFQPISMVICVQSSDRLADDMLDQVRKTAYLFTQQVLGEFGELLAEAPGGHALEGVHQLGHGDLRREVHEEVDVVVRAVELDQLGLEVLAHGLHDLLAPRQVPVGEDRVPVLRHENQVDMHSEDAVTTCTNVLIDTHKPTV